VILRQVLQRSLLGKHLASYKLWIPSGEGPEERVLRPGSVTSQLHADLKIHDNVG